MRFYKDRRYIGVQHHQKDSWGDWRDVTTAKLFLGRPDLGFYGDEVYEYTPVKWQELKCRVLEEAKKLGREFAETSFLLTSYPIWHST